MNSNSIDLERERQIRMYVLDFYVSLDVRLRNIERMPGPRLSAYETRTRARRRREEEERFLLLLDRELRGARYDAMKLILDALL